MLKFMETMLTGISSKTLNFNILMWTPAMKFIIFVFINFIIMNLYSGITMKVLHPQ